MVDSKLSRADCRLRRENLYTSFALICLAHTNLLATTSIPHIDSIGVHHVLLVPHSTFTCIIMLPLHVCTTAVRKAYVSRTNPRALT